MAITSDKCVSSEGNPTEPPANYLPLTRLAKRKRFNNYKNYLLQTKLAQIFVKCDINSIQITRPGRKYIIINHFQFSHLSLEITPGNEKLAAQYTKIMSQYIAGRSVEQKIDADILTVSNFTKNGYEFL